MGGPLSSPRRSSLRRAARVLAVGAVLAVLPVVIAVLLWPRPQLRTEVALAERYTPRSTAPVPVTAAAPAADPGDAAPRTPSFEELSWPTQRRLGWAHERAAWTGGGWVLCDVSHLDVPSRTGASLQFDERGLTHDVDLATSVMLVHDGWLPLSVHEPDGTALMEVNSRRARVSWWQAAGEVPGGCAVELAPAVATLRVIAVHADGTPYEGDDAFVVGCGRYGDTDSPLELSHARPCVMRIRREAKVLSTWASEGPAVLVHPVPGETIEVHAVIPDAPDGRTLPELDGTLAILDTAAFSGADLAADHLDIVVDDLYDGSVDIDHLARFEQVRDRLQDGSDDSGVFTVDSPMDAIAVAWAAWMELDDTP